jgi:hypothetical protein
MVGINDRSGMISDQLISDQLISDQLIRDQLISDRNGMEISRDLLDRNIVDMIGSDMNLIIHG